MDVHVRDLRYFLAVADERNFTRAAVRLYISQPALSKQVRQLEQLLHARLFRRGSRDISLTAAGEALLPYARDQVRLWAEAQRQVSEAAAVDSEVLTVGFSAAVARGILAAASETFSRNRPGWRLQLRQISWDDPTAGLARSQTDVALSWLPAPDPERFAWQVLVSEPRSVALPARHRLADATEVPFADLADEPFLALPDSAGELRDYWLATDHRGGRPPRIGGIVTSVEETFEAVANGLGVALLSAGNADIYRHSGVVTRPVSGVSPSRLAVAWRLTDTRHATASFVEACAAAAAVRQQPATSSGGRVPESPVPSGSHALPRTLDQLRVAVSGYADDLQQQLLTAFSHAPPPTPVTSTPSDSTRSRVEAVASGAVDLAFVRLAAAPLPGLAYRHLGTAALLLAVPAEHPLAGWPAEPTGVPLAALHEQPLAFYHRAQNPWWYDSVLGLLHEHGATPRIVHRGLWTYDTLPIVAAGRALALVTASVAATARLQGVVYRRPDPPSLTISQGLLWRHNDQPPAVRRFLETADQLLPAEPPQPDKLGGSPAS